VNDLPRRQEAWQFLGLIALAGKQYDVRFLSLNASTRRSMWCYSAAARSSASASHQLAADDVCHWRMAFRLALDEIAALVGLATKPKRPPMPARPRADALRLVDSGDVATVRKSAS